MGGGGGGGCCRFLARYDGGGGEMETIRSVNNSVFQFSNGGVFRYWYRTAMCINIRLFSHQIFTATYVRKGSR